jgi:hypothetical protein
MHGTGYSNISGKRGTIHGFWCCILLILLFLYTVTLSLLEYSFVLGLSGFSLSIRKLIVNIILRSYVTPIEVQNETLLHIADNSFNKSLGKL